MVWGSVLLPQTLLRLHWQWMESCLLWILDTANSRCSIAAHMSFFFPQSSFWKVLVLYTSLHQYSHVFFFSTGFQSSHWNGCSAGLSHQPGECQPAFRQSRTYRTRAVLQVMALAFSFFLPWAFVNTTGIEPETWSVVGRRAIFGFFLGNVFEEMCHKNPDTASNASNSNVFCLFGAEQGPKCSDGAGYSCMLQQLEMHLSWCHKQCLCNYFHCHRRTEVLHIRLTQTHTGQNGLHCKWDAFLWTDSADMSGHKPVNNRFWHCAQLSLSLCGAFFPPKTRSAVTV